MTNKNNKNEIWKKVPIYNYEVSNFGRIRNATTKKIKAQFINNCNYHQVNFGLKRDENGNPIIIDGKKHQYAPMVARLVAEAFIPIPQDLLDAGYTADTLEVNHLSEDKHTNTVDNLEWVTRTQNLNYGTRNIRHSNYAQNMSESHRRKLSEAAKKRGVHPNTGHRVKLEVTYPDGHTEIFDYINKAARELGYNPSRIHYNAKIGEEVDGLKFRKIFEEE